MCLKRWVLLLFSVASFVSVQTLFSNDIIVEPPRPSCKKVDKFEISWILQFANHFTQVDPTVWKLRYFSNLDYFDHGGPMYVIIGGPWEISPHFVCGGLVVNAAKITRGAVFYIEHRFYGQSHAARLTTKDDLHLLNRDQIIEDIRAFVEYQKTHLLGLEESNIILVGSFYAGSLAAWTQQKYPQLIAGVWATGAPLQSTDAIPGFINSIRLFVKNAGGDKCLKNLDNAFSTIKKELDSADVDEYSQIFNICKKDFDFQNLYDQSTFIYHLSNIIIRSVMFNKPEDISQELCYDLLGVEYLDTVEALAAYVLGQSRTWNRCDNYSFQYFLNRTVSKSANYAWMFQSCSELGWFAIGEDNDANNHLVPKIFYQAICYNLFSMLAEERATAQNHTDKFLTGIVNGDENIILTYGLIDPWTFAGISDMRRTEDRILIFLRGISHYNTIMHSVNRNDSLEMQEAKMIILNRLEVWAKQDRTAIKFSANSQATTSEIKVHNFFESIVSIIIIRLLLKMIAT